MDGYAQTQVPEKEIENSDVQEQTLGVENFLASLTLSDTSVSFTGNRDTVVADNPATQISNEVPASPTETSEKATGLKVIIDSVEANRDTESSDKEVVPPISPNAAVRRQDWTEAILTPSVTHDDDHIFDPSPLHEPLQPLEVDEELLSALRSLDFGDDPIATNEDNPFDLLELTYALDDLEVDSSDQEYLSFPQDFSDVFNDVVGQDLEEENSDPNIVAYQEEDEEPFPWHLLCRPCQPHKDAPPVDPREVLSDEELLELSLLTMADNAHVLDHHDDDDDDTENDNANVDQQYYDDSFQSYIVSRRGEAVEAAMTFTHSFGTGLYQPPMQNHTPSNERTCFGHKETIYSVNFSDCGTYLVTASQDATVCVWDVATNSLLSTLTGHNKDYECLRSAWAPSCWPWSTGSRSQTSFIASGGADGVVKIWASPDPSKKNSWECVNTLDHGSFEGRIKGAAEGNQDEDAPQIYALQFITHWQGLPPKNDNGDGDSEKNSFLMTSSDDYIHLWELIETETRNDSADASTNFDVSEVFSIRFTAMEDVGSGVSACRVTSAGLQVPPQQQDADATSNKVFGGERNPSNLIYAFDASYCNANGLLGVALSDGTVRLVNGRGVCVSALSLPGCSSHLTSLTWDSTGTRLASCVATGHLILWQVDIVANHPVVVSCVSILEGGHAPGRPLFGARYCGATTTTTTQDLLLTWGVDGRLCLWDSHSHGQIHAPLSTLVSRADYPIYAVDLYQNNSNDSIVLAVGGGRDGGFLGMPLYLYDISSLQPPPIETMSQLKKEHYEAHDANEGIEA